MLFLTTMDSKQFKIVLKFVVEGINEKITFPCASPKIEPRMLSEPVEQLHKKAYASLNQNFRSKKKV